MTRDKPVPDPIIADYITELSTNGVVSYSHVTLSRLYSKHGQEFIDNLLRDYFYEVRKYDT